MKYFNPFLSLHNLLRESFKNNNYRMSRLLHLILVILLFLLHDLKIINLKILSPKTREELGVSGQFYGGTGRFSRVLFFNFLFSRY
jgi:hypothetical protein